jgi:hypothetical protein
MAVNQEEVKKQLMARWNSARLAAGMTMLNANGDIDQASTGYLRAIDTMTYIKKRVVEQKFFEIPFADYLPVEVGEAAFAANILTNLTLSTSGDFEEGIINQGLANSRLAEASAAVTSVTVPVITWAKEIGYSLIEIEQALVSNNWDLIESREKSRKKNWDLGLQKIAFLGSALNTSVTGLYTLSNVNSDIATITKKISAMSVSEFNTFVAAVIEAYRANCNRTAEPTDFYIPEDDWNGLLSMVTTAGYSAVSKLEYLKKAFTESGIAGGVTMRKCAYGMPSYNASYGLNGGSGYQRYVMLRKDRDTLRMDVPVNYTSTQPNSINNFQFQNAAYGQFTGVVAYRPLEVLYFDF